MSGPKVVRIVTRDEIIAICKGQLAGLNEVVQEWTKVCRGNDAITEAEIEATVARQSALVQLLAEDRFSELQKAIATEIDFLKADQKTRLERAALKKANVYANQRRTEAAAAGVLAALDRKRKPVSNNLRTSLEQIAAGRSEDTSAISQAFALLTDAERPDTVSERQRKLAAAHKDTEDSQSFNEWLATQSATQPDEEFKRLDVRLAELAVVLGEKAASEFQKRLRSLFTQVPSPGRSLLTDSLELDLAQAVSRAKERKEVQLRLRTLAAELSGVGSEDAKRFSQTIVAQLEGPMEGLIELEKHAQEVLEQAVKRVAARSRRQAVLKGLAELGYQVSEGMETAWVQDGRIVLKRTLESGYGVEISGRTDSGRVQMRTVAFRSPGSAIDNTSDRIAETAFCSDVSKLQAEFSLAGNEILIERATPVGATPLKTVSVADIRHEESQQLVTPTAKQRSIK